MPDEASSFAEAAAEFAVAWDNPNHTRFELPPVDVNRVLGERYTMAGAFRMTRTQLWDMEAKKAWDPFSYIPYVVTEGSSWGRHHLDATSERFFRASNQAAWIEPTRGRVLEDVFVDHAAQKVYFMGRASFASATGEPVNADPFQPLFHVEHAAEGAEDDPLNIWRIVILTPSHDPRFEEPFKKMAAAGLLPGFVEIYIERDCGVPLQRRAT